MRRTAISYAVQFRLIHRDSSMVVIVAFRICGPGALLGRVDAWNTCESKGSRELRDPVVLVPWHNKAQQVGM